MDSPEINSLKSEIKALNNKLILLGEARNQEILDLQYRFADQLRELQRSKGFDKEDDFNILVKKVGELEATIIKKDQEIDGLRMANIELEKQLKNEIDKHEKTSFLLEKSRVQLFQAQDELSQAKQLVEQQKDDRVDMDEVLKPFEEQVDQLRQIITKQNTELVNLRQLVHEECAERMRLQKLLGMIDDD